MSELTWKRCTRSKPPVGAYVLLHTPQYGMTLGDVTTGEWDGSEWSAHDGRDFEGSPPIHWALIGMLPAYEGSKKDWAFAEAEF